ncbi:MAG: type IV secretion system protein [Patescibacteria group bacterium]
MSSILLSSFYAIGYLAEDSNLSKILLRFAEMFDIEDLEHISSLAQAIAQQIISWLSILGTFSKLAANVVENSQYVSLENNQLETGWGYAIFFVNIIAIFVLIAIALANALRLNIETYAIKKTLPALIAGFIIANFSLLLCKALLDVGDLMIVELNTIFGGDIINKVLNTTIGIDLSGTNTNMLNAFIDRFSSTDLNTIVLAVNNIGDEAELAELKLIINLLIAAFFYSLPCLAIIVLAFVSIIRNIILYILIVLAPLGIILLFFPPSKAIGEKWLNYFLTWNFILPIIFFILGLSTIFSPTVDVNDNDFTQTIVSYMSGIFVLLFAIFIPLSLSSFGQQITSYLMMAPLYGQNPLRAVTNLLGGNNPMTRGIGGGVPPQSTGTVAPPPTFPRTALTNIDEQGNYIGPTGGGTSLANQNTPETQSNKFIAGFNKTEKEAEVMTEEPQNKNQDRNNPLTRSFQEYQKRLNAWREKAKQIGAEAQRKDKTQASKNKISPLAAGSAGGAGNTGSGGGAGTGTGQKIEWKGNELSQKMGVAVDQLTSGTPPQFNVASYVSDRSTVAALADAKTPAETNKIIQSIPVEVRNQYDSNISAANITTGEGVKLQSLNDLVSYNRDIQSKGSQQATQIIKNNPNISADNVRGIMTSVRNGDIKAAIDAASSPELKQLIQQGQQTNNNYQTLTTLNQITTQLTSSQNISTTVQKGLDATPSSAPSSATTATSTPRPVSTTIPKYNTVPPINTA